MAPFSNRSPASPPSVLAHQTSRRAFLQSTAKLAGGAVALGVLSVTAVSHPNPTAARAPVAGYEGAVLRSSSRWRAAASLDPEMRAVLDEYASFGLPPIHTLSPLDARRRPTLGDAAESIRAKQGLWSIREPVGSVVARLVPRDATGGHVLVRIYAPKGVGPYPVLVYFHGGGWVHGSIDQYDASARALTNASGCIVASVAYQQAPVSRPLAAVADASHATQWIIANSHHLNADPSRIAIGGEGAGGNLAAAVALQLRDAGAHLPVRQLLIYPAMDSSLSLPSHVEHTRAEPFGREDVAWSWRHHLSGASRLNRVNTSPLQADNFSNLPSATIITADIDPLRDDGAAYTARLRDAGVSVRYLNYEGVTHDFFGLTSVLGKARHAVAEAAHDLRAAFASNADE